MLRQIEITVQDLHDKTTVPTIVRYVPLRGTVEQVIEALVPKLRKCLEKSGYFKESKK